MAAHSHSRQQGEHDEGERGQFVAAEAGNGRVERGDVVAGQIADCGPDPHPEGRTHRVQDQKPREAHPGHPGNEPIGLAQHADKPGERDNLAAVSSEERFCPGHPMRGQQDIPAKPGQQPAATVTADEPADVVARHRGHECDHGHHRDVQPARARVDRSSDHHCLARDRHAEVLQQKQRAHRDVPVLVQVRRDGGEQAGQRRTRHRHGTVPG